jgi:ATP-dependent protease ClpP protease subunit
VSRVEPHPVLANRWVAVEHIDDNTCQPCLDNDGKLYKNREDAYADYPNGKGFVDCVGEEFGNHCRGKVAKRRGGNAMTPEQVAAIESMRKASALFSAKTFTTVETPRKGLILAHPGEKYSARWCGPRVTDAEAVAEAEAFNAATSTNTQLYVYDYIGGYDGITAMDVVEALIGVTGDVDVHINSGGGEIFEGAAIYAALDNYAGGTVRSYVDGVAASAASVIMLAGEEIVMEPAATVMVHAGSGGVYGTAKDMRAQADVLDMLTETMAGIYAARVGGDTAEWLALLNSGDTWYTAQTALDAKLVTRIGGSANRVTPSNATVPDLLSALHASFTSGRQVRVQPEPTPVASVDVEGIHTALKGLFA